VGVEYGFNNTDGKSGRELHDDERDEWRSGRLVDAADEEDRQAASQQREAGAEAMDQRPGRDAGEHEARREREEREPDCRAIHAVVGHLGRQQHRAHPGAQAYQDEQCVGDDNRPLTVAGTDVHSYLPT
jgi:hypothetical protein